MLETTFVFFLFLICGYHIEQQGAPRKLLKFSLSYKYLDATFYIHTFETTFSTFLLQTLFPMNFTVKYFDILLFHRNITIWHESKQRMCVKWLEMIAVYYLSFTMFYYVFKIWCLLIYRVIKSWYITKYLTFYIKRLLSIV